jgi:hypothetical protein
MVPNNPPPPPNQDSSQQATSFLTFETIHIITGGSNLTFENKRQKREHYHQVNPVAVEGPIVRTKWSHIQITFTEADIKLASLPLMDAMVSTADINKWNVTRDLVDNGSQAKILFLSTFEQMGFSKKQLKEASKLLYGFSGKKIEPVGSISLPVSFGTLSILRLPFIQRFDNAKQFDCHLFKNFCYQIGVEAAFASVYHPQSNGAVEKANTLIFTAIKKILENQLKGKWIEELPRAV